MLDDWRIEPLHENHDRAHFCCGSPALDAYLSHLARQNQDKGLARTFVAVREAMPLLVEGYYSLAANSIDKSNFPPEYAKKFPNLPLPIALLARLAIDQTLQRRGLGQHLMVDALRRCWRVSQELGITAVLVDAKDESAKAYYSRFEFEALPAKPLTLWLPLPALRKLFQAQGE